ncbi:MAG: hypothetical protein HY922_02885 [Elusimicrobia bacterium]|nr:hypothetical protein [Elusimicrobiota bacterium]
MTTKERKRLENLLRARLKDKAAMLRASRAMDALRRRFGKPSEDFDSLALLRHVRYAQ